FPSASPDHSARSSSPFSQVPGAAARRPHQAPPVRHRHRHRVPLPLHPRAHRLPQRLVPLAASSGGRGRPRGADAGRRVPGAAARGRGLGGRPHARAGGGCREAPPPQEEAEGPGQTPSGVACCYSCGAPLHTDEEGSPGHVEPATCDLKKRHNQLKTVICEQCKLLSHGRCLTK
uniref:Uncharacterized protein n=2 Tax=Aegilops tauschii subsp. strangulata TaxID=200361 RepID=A0A453Q8B6_AEGTS